MKSSKLQGGFTFVELVIVIIVVGILAAIALPKFINLAPDSQTTTTKNVAGTLAAASSINYTTRKVNSAKGAAVANCSDVFALLQNNFPSGYTITAASISADATVTCTLNGPGGASASFNATGIN